MFSGYRRKEAIISSLGTGQRAGLAVACLSILALLVFQCTGSDAVELLAPVTVSLSEAAAGGDLEVASAILAAGADPDKPLAHGFTPLMRAAIREDTQMVRLLLEAGADYEATAQEGLTPLHVAAEAGAVEAVRTLLGAGADLNIRSHNGMNTLQHAAAAGSADVIVAIAATGVDLDAQSKVITQGHGYPIDEGSTALGIAARGGHIDAIAALLEHGADVDGPSLIGHTPLLVATFSGQPPEIISVLLEAGADPKVRAACRTRCSFDEGDVLIWSQRLGDPNATPLIQAALEKLTQP